MIQLFLVRIRFRIGFADAFCDNFRVAFFMTCIFTVLTLHTSRILQEVSTEGTPHNVVELLQDKFMAEHFMNLFFTLTYSTFAIQTNVERSAVCYLFCCVELVNQVPTMRKGIGY